VELGPGAVEGVGVNPILVTGASGFVGSHLVRSLALQGFDVVSLFHKSRVEQDKRHFRIDLRDGVALGKLFRQFRFSAVIHLAAAGVSAEAETLDDVAAVNILATASLARLAMANSVERFVHVGTGFEYRPQAQPMDESTPLGAPNLYGASKAAGWMLLDALHRLEGLPLVTFRPFSVYGPGESAGKLVPYTILQAQAGEPIRLTLGSQVRDYVFVEDVIDALRLGLSAPAIVGKVYNIGSGPAEARSVRRMVEEIVEMMGAPARLCWFDRATRGRCDPPFLVSDPTKAHLELGWRPRVSLADGLARTIESYKAAAVKELSA
jgi:nucleoside-diphosphate-sugar epimerase